MATPTARAATQRPADFQRPNPYVGPRSFKTGEKLYGRERDAQALLDLLIAERIVLLYSPSGAGKSSLVQAALLPQLRVEGFHCLPPVRVNLEPPADVSRAAWFNRYLYSLLASLDEALPPAQQSPAALLANLSLEMYLQQRHTLTPENEAEFAGEVLIFDQFEEILTLDPTDIAAKQTFFRQVGEALRDHRRWALFVMREDYVGALEPYLRFLPTRLARTYRLDLLHPNAAQQAMQRPAQLQGVVFTSAAAAQLSNDLRRMQLQAPDGAVLESFGPHIEPVQLQVVCCRLWQNLAPGARTIEVADVTALGQVDTALADYYAERVQDVAIETHVYERHIREWCDRSLITPQGIRGQVLLGRTHTEGLPNPAVRALESAYIIRAEKRGGVTWFELAHDRLIKPVQLNNAEWFEAHLTPLQRQADIWQRQQRPESLLFQDADLRAATVWANTHKLLPAEQEFLAASQRLQARRDAERRTAQTINVLGGLAVLVSLVALYFGVQNWWLAREAYARQLANAALYNLSTDAELSTLLAFEALHARDGDIAVREAEIALHRAVEALRLQTTFRDHTSEVLNCSFNADATLAVSASEDATALVWRPTTGEVVFRLTDHTDYVTSALFDPTGRFIATGSWDTTARLWEAATGQPGAVFSHPAKVMALTFSPDGQTLVVGLADGEVVVWDVATQTLLAQFAAHTKGVESVVFNADGTRLATASYDQTVKVWRWPSAELLHTLPHDYYALDVAFHPTLPRLATASADRLVRMWDLSDPAQATPPLLFKITAHTNWVWGVEFSPDGERLATSSADRSVQVWNANTGAAELLLGGHRRSVYNVAYSPEGQRLLSCGEDATARVWNVGLSQELFTFVHPERVYGAAFSPDGTLLATGGQTRTAQIWDATTGALRLTLAGHTGAVESIFFSPDGARVATASRDGTAKIWEAQTGTLLQTFTASGPLFGAVFSPGPGILLATASTSVSPTVQIWEANAGGPPLQTLEIPESGRVNSVAFRPDGQAVIGAYADQTARVWDLSTGQVALTLTGHTDEVNYALFSPDGRYIATGGEDGLVLVWDAQTGGQVFTFTNHLGGIYGLAFSHDSHWLASGSGDKTIKIWDLALQSPWSDRERLTLTGHTDRVYALDFSVDDQRLVSASADGTARVYLLDIAALTALAQSRLTRTSFYPEECQQFSLVHPSCGSPPNLFAWLAPK